MSKNYHTNMHEGSTEATLLCTDSWSGCPGIKPCASPYLRVVTLHGWRKAVRAHGLRRENGLRHVSVRACTARRPWRAQPLATK